MAQLEVLQTPSFTRMTHTAVEYTKDIYTPLLPMQHTSLVSSPKMDFLSPLMAPQSPATVSQYCQQTLTAAKLLQCTSCSDAARLVNESLLD